MGVIMKFFKPNQDNIPWEQRTLSLPGRLVLVLIATIFLGLMFVCSYYIMGVILSYFPNLIIG